MKQIKLTLLFLILNFGALAIGNWFMGNAVQEHWYTSLNKAPWTPPGWFFGLAWTTIMVCFSIYLSNLFCTDQRTNFLIFVFVIEFLLNISWNYLFFNQQLVLFALIIILLLTSLLFIYFFKLSEKSGNFKYLLLPYIIWLCIANSLNIYILIHN